MTLAVDQSQENLIHSEHVRTVFYQFPVAVAAQTLNASVVAALLWYQTATSRSALLCWLAAVAGLGLLRTFALPHCYATARARTSWQIGACGDGWSLGCHQATGCCRVSKS